MGLFNFFKKNKDGQPPGDVPSEPGNDLYTHISKYNDHIALFISMQQQGNFAPISAYEKKDGEICGFLYMIDDNSTYTLSVDEAVNRMKEKFESEIQAGEIGSYVILYHSQFSNDGNHAMATKDEELKAITVMYCFANGTAGYMGMPYRFDGDTIRYGGFTEFTHEQNTTLLNTSPQQGKDYFPSREELKAPVFENAIGLKITRSNNQDLSNTWCGIFGFTRYREQNGRELLTECITHGMMNRPVWQQNSISTRETGFNNVLLKTVALNDTPVFVIPVVQTGDVVDVENKEIAEWENVNNFCAIISGNGRNTFGLWYLATDYAENRERYHTQKKLDMHISGIVFVLDVYTARDNDSVPYSEDFTAYMPSSDLPNFACFDFIGQLEEFSETTGENGVKGFLLNVRLITNPDIKNFFTINMYVAAENMRFTELVKGMKISGMFQMQGCIAG